MQFQLNILWGNVDISVGRWESILTFHLSSIPALAIWTFLCCCSHTQMYFGVQVKTKRKLNTPKHDVLAALKFILEESFIFWGTAARWALCLHTVPLLPPLPPPSAAESQTAQPWFLTRSGGDNMWDCGRAQAGVYIGCGQLSRHDSLAVKVPFRAAPAELQHQLQEEASSEQAASCQSPRRGKRPAQTIRLTFILLSGNKRWAWNCTSIANLQRRPSSRVPALKRGSLASSAGDASWWCVTLPSQRDQAARCWCTASYPVGLRCGASCLRGRPSSSPRRKFGRNTMRG